MVDKKAGDHMIPGICGHVGASCLNFYSDRKTKHYSKHSSKIRELSYQLLTEKQAIDCSRGLL